MNETIPITTTFPISSYGEQLPTVLSSEHEAYRVAIENLALCDDETVFHNNSPAHAAIVLGNILQKANKSVKIFAGDFNGAVSNYDYYLNSLKEFLEKDKPITIIFENEPSNDSIALKLIRSYKDTNKYIKVKRLSGEKNDKPHFTIADGKMFRFETSKENYKALCSFNNILLSSSLEKVFSKLEAASEDI